MPLVTNSTNTTRGPQKPNEPGKSNRITAAREDSRLRLWKYPQLHSVGVTGKLSRVAVKLDRPQLSPVDIKRFEETARDKAISD